jgi:transketolase
MSVREARKNAAPQAAVKSASGGLVHAASHAEMANAIRALTMDAVQAANSGHPGMPMGMADIATVLFQRYLTFDPNQPDWPDRDRFVLSAGHGSMLLYSLLFLTGYPGMSIDDIKHFRQLGSHTPGHPEFGAAAGIETTTGPLGQGLANAVGMALGERHLAAHFGEELVNHYTYALAGDGCLMEGISQEAISLAGHLQLRKLIVLFDDNQISIDGPTSLTTSDDVAARFAACGWDTWSIDGHDTDQIADAIAAARESARPALVACRTVIGFGAPNKQGTAATHGSPLGAEEIEAARAQLGWPSPPFDIPAHILRAWRDIGARGAATADAWQSRLQSAAPDTRSDFERRLAGDLPNNFDATVRDLKSDLVETIAKAGEKLATRKASQNVLKCLNSAVPELLGGSADLTGSNLTRTDELRPFSADNYGGRYIYYGVREHAMAAVMNGLALHRGIIPYGGTFLVFTDYMRPALRLSALIGLRVVYVMTHDSIGLGEDGPTHQPVEHLAALRAIPNLQVMRPADAVETAECWALALAAPATPTVISLTRQGVPPVRLAHTDENLCARGAYELVAASGPAKATIFATGSEIAIATTARETLEADGTPTRVVSVPCQELFASQDDAYRRNILGPNTVRVAVEAATEMGWERYIGADGGFVGMTSFGASAPADTLYEHFRITADTVVEAVRKRLS